MASGLSLTVLGCDGSYPGRAGACSGYLVQFADTAIWLDAGSGSLANLQRFIGLDELDAVVISHAHPDHFTDLEPFCVALKWYLKCSGPAVFAPEGLEELMRVGGSRSVVQWYTIDEKSNLQIGGMHLSFSRTDHPVPTFATRIDAGGVSLGYSADTGPAWEFSSLGRGIDLALCEATFLSDEEGSVQHLSARQAGRTASRAGARRLVITHLAPGVNRDSARAEATEEFASQVEVAAIGQVYEI